MFGIFRDGINIASFSKKEDAYRYGITKGWFIKDLRKLHSGWWREGYELKEIPN
jgi:hypothetical protein